MKRIFLFAQTLLMTGACCSYASAAMDQDNSAGSTIQQITVNNMLWNNNSPSQKPGLTPTSIVVAFNNGGANPCFKTTLAFQGSVTVKVGQGQPCIAAVTSVSFAPVAGPVGAVYATPANEPVNGAYFTTQMLVENGTDPVFDTTNDVVTSQGVMQITTQGK
jgi:hypothetical protein